jgi:hypothetical protein
MKSSLRQPTCGSKAWGSGSTQDKGRFQDTQGTVGRSVVGLLLWLGRCEPPPFQLHHWWTIVSTVHQVGKEAGSKPGGGCGNRGGG